MIGQIIKNTKILNGQEKSQKDDEPTVIGKEINKATITQPILETLRKSFLSGLKSNDSI